jgi:hypothetical protein
VAVHSPCLREEAQAAGRTGPCNYPRCGPTELSIPRFFCRGAQQRGRLLARKVLRSARDKCHLNVQCQRRKRRGCHSTSRVFKVPTVSAFGCSLWQDKLAAALRSAAYHLAFPAPVGRPSRIAEGSQQSISAVFMNEPGSASPCRSIHALRPVHGRPATKHDNLPQTPYHHMDDPV